MNPRVPVFLADGCSFSSNGVFVTAVFLCGGGGLEDGAVLFVRTVGTSWSVGCLFP